MTIDDLIKILQASIAPVVLISGVGLLLLTITNRLGRSMDRIRQLCAEFESAPKNPSAIKAQIPILYKRCQYLRVSLFLSIASVVCVSIIIFLLFSIYIFHINLIKPVILLFEAGLVMLILSLLYFLLDVWAALRSLKIEIKNTFGDQK
ncbi:MAG TPA: DUF2721 domain-containing protein [Candidatus Omnitrophota bacterium]|nr:DUF2721 domain-containing protein [Candidatus Omnitrophota bacterium]